MVSGTCIDSGAVLAAARRLRAEADRAEAGVLASAVEWARLHVVNDLEDAATWVGTPVPVAGPGAPLVAEFCVAEFAAALGMGTEAGRRLIGQGLELAHRLPRLWVRVQEGRLQAWKARRIADETMDLSLEAAGFVDQQVAPYASKIGQAQLGRLVDAAITRFMPEFAQERREGAAEQRFFQIDHQQVSFAGTSKVYGELDLADALDLETAVQTGAAQLADLGSTDTLDVRRAAAVGVLARGQLTLGLEAPAPAPTRPVRDVVLYVHLDQSDLAEVEGHGLLTKAQVALWCGAPETRVIVKPVIDLNKPLTTKAYAVPDRIREQIILRDRTCVFPWCNKSARHADIDHIDPYDGQNTATENLAPLCRHHHRLKTHAGWTYTHLESGVFLWRSPYGYTYLRTRDGTEDLTPDPQPPP